MILILYMIKTLLTAELNSQNTQLQKLRMTRTAYVNAGPSNSDVESEGFGFVPVREGDQ